MHRYGVTNIMYNKYYFKKSIKHKYKLKQYFLPSGKMIEIQGYEPQVYDWLFKNNIKESDIIHYPTSIKYTFEDKNKLYYPDIQIGNNILEVKSDYTLQVNWDINLAKAEACQEQGFNFYFLVYNPKSKCVNIH